MFIDVEYYFFDLKTSLVRSINSLLMKNLWHSRNFHGGLNFHSDIILGISLQLQRVLLIEPCFVVFIEDGTFNIISMMYLTHTPFKVYGRLNCLSQWRGEPKFSTALAPRSVDVSTVLGKEEKSEQNQPPRSRRAGTAPRGAPIFYRARAERIFSRRAVFTRVSLRQWGRQCLRLYWEINRRGTKNLPANFKSLFKLEYTVFGIWLNLHAID